MKKVGIITRYYESSNYGGLLQAYALCRHLNSIGMDAEQICYQRDAYGANNTMNTMRKMPVRQIVKKIKNFVNNKVIRIITKLIVNKYNARRFEATKAFRDGIPHSDDVFCAKTVDQCNDRYDIFITGSDRVWDINHMESPMFLNFVKDKPKYSYAASMMANQLTPEKKEMLDACLRSYTAISVREKETCDIIAPIKAEWVVDPTLLLSSAQWDEVASEPRIRDEYIFCYFLGDDRRNRRIAKAFAKKHNLKIVTMPYVEGRFNFADICFGDVRLFDVAPGEFISLIKHAKYIFTDSFHGTVFSSIYKKECFSLYRQNKMNSGTRLESLAALLGTQSHLCMSKERVSLKYLERVPPVDYEAVEIRLKDMLEKSKGFLMNIT